MSLKHDSFKKLRKDKKKWKVSTPQEFEEREDAFLKMRLINKEPTIDTFVRISGGKAKNFKLEIPKTTRPLTDRMKIKIFDILREDIVNKDILDLYAGTGSFGLEALSRGAKTATFVDASKNAYFTLQKNISHTGYLPESEIIKLKTEDYLHKQSNLKKPPAFDIIFLDPPYKLFNTKNTYKMEKIINMASLLIPGIQDSKTNRFKGAIIIKHPKRYPIDKLIIKGMNKLETYRIGLNCISIYIVNLTK